MFLKIVVVTLSFVPFSLFSMENSGPSIEDVDHAWYLRKLVDYKNAREKKQQHDYIVTYLQKKSQSNNTTYVPGDIVPRMGVAPSSYSFRAKL